MKHSKGPWSLAVWNQTKGRQEIVDAHDDTVCMVGVGNLPTFEADARLISAAPELLEACKYALKVIPIMHPDVREILRAATAKAEAPVGKL